MSKKNTSPSPYTVLISTCFVTYYRYFWAVLKKVCFRYLSQLVLIVVQIKKERDKEIELVIERLEEDASTVREENERSTEQKIR